MREPLSLAAGREALAAARAAAGGAAVEVTLEETRSELTRFANNAIHQHVGETAAALSVRTQMGGRTARAATHRLDGAGVREATERALALTRAQAEDPELLPMAEPQAGYPAVERHDAATAAITPGERAEAVQAMIETARAAGLTAAGTCATQETRLAILNSNGLEAFHAATGAEYSLTMLGASSSGWAKGSSWRWRDLNPAAAAAVAREKAEASADPIELKAQPITVILEPAAVLDLLGFAMWDFGALAVLDQRSFLCERLGTKLFGENVTIHDDAGHALQTGPGFDGEGIPRQRLTLVEKGTVRELAFARQTAAEWNKRHPGAGKRATGHGFPLPNEYGEAPLNVVFEGGETSLEEMIAATERGVLVTRLWYIREVDPYQKILTGMTRDGTFLIEGGAIRRGVRNFRFNQSMVELLNRIVAMSPAVRASGEESFDMVVPALKVEGFNFTEVTRF